MSCRSRARGCFVYWVLLQLTSLLAALLVFFCKGVVHVTTAGVAIACVAVAACCLAAHQCCMLTAGLYHYIRINLQGSIVHTCAQHPQHQGSAALDLASCTQCCYEKRTGSIRALDEYTCKLFPAYRYALTPHRCSAALGLAIMHSPPQSCPGKTLIAGLSLQCTSGSGPSYTCAPQHQDTATLVWAKCIPHSLTLLSKQY